MPELSTLSYVADLVIRRTLAEATPDTDLAKALNDAYPFDNSVQARRVWLDALIRYALTPEAVNPAEKANTASAGQG